MNITEISAVFTALKAATEIAGRNELSPTQGSGYHVDSASPRQLIRFLDCISIHPRRKHRGIQD